MQLTEVINIIPLTEIHYDDDFNCRGAIIATDVVDLAKDIQTHGLLQPVLVTPYPEDHPSGKKYLLIAGYRRYMAHRINGDDAIKCVVKEGIDEKRARIINLSENLKRKELNILQEAKALEKLESLGVTEANAMQQLGMARGWVQVRYMVLRLPEDVQNEIAAGMLSQKNIRDIYSHFKVSGKEGATETLKKLTDLRIKGQKDVRIKTTENKRKEMMTSKRHRKRPEIFEMMCHIQENFGNSITTRALSWCAGELTDIELYQSLKEDDHTGTYAIPEL